MAIVMGADVSSRHIDTRARPSQPASALAATGVFGRAESAVRQWEPRIAMTRRGAAACGIARRAPEVSGPVIEL